MDRSRTLTVQPGRYAICRLAPGAPVPEWALASAFFSITRTADELSLVVEDDRVPPDVTAAPGWRLLRVEGVLDFSLTGILAGICAALAGAGVSIFALSTYDTDYVLVRQEDLDRACEALRAAGYGVVPAPTPSEGSDG